MGVIRIIIGLLLFLSVGHAQDLAPYIIPFVEPHAEIWITNGDQPQTVIVVIGESFQKHELKKWQTIRITAKSRGFVRIGRTYPVMAWAVVQGTMFPAVTANATCRVFSLTKETGIAIANPFGEDVSATLWLFGDTVTAVTITIPKLGQYVGFMNLPAGTAVLASTQPLAVGAARCMLDICESVPVATIGGQ